MKLILTPWKALLLSSVERAEESVTLVAPYIKAGIAAEIIARAAKRSLEVRVSTRCKVDNFAARVSDVEALAHFHRELPNSVRLDNRLHAKVFVFDRALAYIGSSNLTSAGLERNYESVIEVADIEGASHVNDEMMSLWSSSHPVTNDVLDDQRHKVALRIRSSPSPATDEGLFYNIPEFPLSPAQDVIHNDAVLNEAEDSPTISMNVY